MRPPAPPLAADIVLIELTYGNRVHPASDIVAQLGAAIQRTCRRGGVVLIPAFSVGRTQSLLYAIYLLKMRGEIRVVPVFLNSPMSIKATEIYGKFRADNRLSKEECMGMCPEPPACPLIESSAALPSCQKTNW
jgi:metallo-beta-lactamase family protein